MNSITTKSTALTFHCVMSVSLSDIVYVHAVFEFISQSIVYLVARSEIHFLVVNTIFMMGQYNIYDGSKFSYFAKYLSQ